MTQNLNVHISTYGDVEEVAAGLDKEEVKEDDCERF